MTERELSDKLADLEQMFVMRISEITPQTVEAETALDEWAEVFLARGDSRPLWDKLWQHLRTDP